MPAIARGPVRQPVCSQSPLSPESLHTRIRQLEREIDRLLVDLKRVNSWRASIYSNLDSLVGELDRVRAAAHFPPPEES